MLPQAYALVLSQLTKLFYPLALTYGLFYVLRTYAEFHVPLWAAIPAAVLSIPSYMIASANFCLWQAKRRAAQHGAVLPPFWLGNSIGSIDILTLLAKSWYGGFLSECHS